MSRPAASPSFNLPRLSRHATRQRNPDPAWSVHLATITFAAMIVLTFLNPFMTMHNDGSESLLRTAGYTIALMLTLIALQPWRRPERLLVVPWPLLLALGWCWLSLVWAIDPVVGVRRLALTSIIIWSLFALVRHIGPDRTVTVLRAMLAILLAVNFLAVLLDPALGIHAEGDGLGGMWRGIMAHKNFAGVTCALAIIFVVFDASSEHPAVRIAIAAGSVVFLVLSDSATSMGMAAAAIVGGFLFGLLAERHGQRRLAPIRLAWLLLLIPAVIFASMAINDEPFLAMASDPAGFTGRTQIWTALIKAYADRPWLGVGFGSFWDLGPSGPIHTYASGWVTEMSEGHQGYLDLLVTIGAVGTLLVLFAMVVFPVQRLLHGGTHPARTLAAAVLLFSVGHNFTESMLFDRDSLVQVFMIVVIALLWEITSAPTFTSERAAPADPAPTDRSRAPLRL